MQHATSEKKSNESGPIKSAHHSMLNKTELNNRKMLLKTLNICFIDLFSEVNHVMKRIFTTVFFLLLIIGSITVLKTHASPELPEIYVNPKDNKFSTETTTIGDTFTVNISTSGWEAPGVFAWELKLYYDPTMLNVTDAFYPAGHFLAFANNFPIPPIKEYEVGFVYFGGVILDDLPDGATGSGVFATVIFEIIAAPPPELSCNLEIKDISFLDYDGNDLFPDIVDGYYEFTLPPQPPAPVYLKVEPEMVSATQAGDEVLINVTINEMEPTLKLTNVTFKLNYNTTLLSTKENLVTPGGTYVSFNVTVEADYVKVIVQMVTEPPFPEDKATLATIKFNATYIPTTLVTSPLHLSNVFLTDIDGNTIQYDHSKENDGSYKVPITTKKEDLNGDGKVDIEDIYVFAKAFGSYPGHPRWDARADIDGNNWIGVIDAVLIAMKFHR